MADIQFDAKGTTATAKKTTLITMILDRSGSMESCKAQVISGFNEYLHSMQIDDVDICLFSLIQFDLTHGREICETVHLAAPVKTVPKLTAQSFQPRGSTPLYDAIGFAVRQIDDAKLTFDRCVTVIMTDGQENASTEWDKGKLGALIKEKEALGNWTFVFLGADQNAWAEVAKFAPDTNMATNTMSYSSHATHATMDMAAVATAAYRGGGQAAASNFFKKDKGTADVEPNKTDTTAPNPFSAKKDKSKTPRA